MIMRTPHCRQCSMGYALGKGISACISDGRPIFLNLHEDRYFCLGKELESSFINLLKDETPNPSEAIAELLGLGILEPSDTCDVPVLCAPPVLANTRLTCNHAPVGSVLSALFGLAQMRMRLRLNGLSGSIAYLHALGREAREFHPSLLEPAATIASAYARASRLFGKHDRCLLWSYALGAALRRQRLPATIVIAVSAWPFVAHAWVQLDRLVVNEDPARIRTFTPILVI